MNRGVALAVTALLLGACGAEENGVDDVTVDPSVVIPIDTGVPVTEPDETGTDESTVVSSPPVPSLVATLGVPVPGWDQPVDLVVWRSSETHVVERPGVIRRMNDDGAPGAVLLDISDATKAEGERGLLGLAYSLDGTRAFVNYTDLVGSTIVARFDVRDDGTFDIASRRQLLEIGQPYPNHNGGDLLVTPDGADLLVFTGDGGAGGDPDRYALDPTSLLGKIVRLDPTSDAPEPEIWSVGLRNPWRVSVDPATDRLWIADVGQNDVEEINVVSLADLRGASFGWSAYEGNRPYNDDQLERHSTYRSIDPVLEYEHENGDCSVSGGTVVRNDDITAIGDWYVFSDFCSGVVRALCVNGTTECGLLALGKVPSSVGVLSDHTGRPWVLSLDGFVVPVVSDR
ncbi:MAG: hypothetical protein RIS33_2015 [Actinomycetota bacterium]